MLDFLHDQQDDDLKSPKSKDTVEKSAPGDDKEQKQNEYFTVKTEGKKLHKSTILLAVLLGAGLLLLLFMIKKGTPQITEAAVPDAEQAKIDVLVARLGGVGYRTEMSTKMDKIIKKFYEFSNTPQVPESQLIKNPFKFDKFWHGWDQGDEDLHSLLGSYSADNLQLLSIMSTGNEDAEWCCMIDDKILYEGDSIKGFKVCEITENYVKLKSNETELVLRLVNY
jgi:preprotein translocase subunit SecG